MIAVEELTIAEVHSALKNGTYTCRHLIQAFLERIEKLDKNGPKLNALLAHSSTALEEADILDAHLNNTGKFIGPLHGIPVIVKDQAETKGIVTTYGSIIAKDHVPLEDATVVTKLKQAGAIILAKSTMPDWATGWISTSSISGLTKNPFSLDRDPGGSSSGTGAAISANFGILGLGEDTGGSIRLPSSFCGLVGLRPTPGLISRKGLCPLIKTTDTPGPMTRTVRDAALMLDVLAGFDENDPWTATAVVAGKPVGGSYASKLEASRSLVSNSRVGVLRKAFGDADPGCIAVKNVINSVFEVLRHSGTTFVDIEIPNLDETLAFTATYLSRSRQDIDGFLANTKPPLNASCEQIHASKQYDERLDLFAGLATGPATPSGDPHYLQRLEDRDAFQMLVIGIMAKYNISAIMFPDAKIPAPLHSDIGRWSAMEFPTNTLLASQLRMPAISVPAGFTEKGLPVGLEIVGLPYAEQTLFELAYGVEQLIHARKAPSLG